MYLFLCGIVELYKIYIYCKRIYDAGDYYDENSLNQMNE